MTFIGLIASRELKNLTIITGFRAVVALVHGGGRAEPEICGKGQEVRETPVPPRDMILFFEPSSAQNL